MVGVLARLSVVVRVVVEVDALDPDGRRRRPARRGEQPGGGLEERRRSGGQLGPHLGTGRADGVHGPADRAVAALGVVGGDVLVELLRGGGGLVGQPRDTRTEVGAVVARPVGDRAEELGRLLGHAADVAAPVPVRARPVLAHVDLLPRCLAFGAGSSNRTRSTPSSSTRGARDPEPGQAGGQGEEATVLADGHDELVAAAREVDLVAADERQPEPHLDAAADRDDLERALHAWAWRPGRRRRTASAARPAERLDPDRLDRAVLRAPQRQPGERLLDLLAARRPGPAPSRPASRRRPRPGRPGWRRRRRRGSRRARASCTSGAPPPARRTRA